MKKSTNYPTNIFTLGASSSDSVTPTSLPKLTDKILQAVPVLNMAAPAETSIEFKKMVLPAQAETAAAPIPTPNLNQINLYIPQEILAKFNSLDIALSVQPTTVNQKELSINQFYYREPRLVREMQLMIHINKEDLISPNFKIIENANHSFSLLALTKDEQTTNHHLIRFNPKDLESSSISIELNKHNARVYVRGFDIIDKPQTPCVPSVKVTLRASTLTSLITASVAASKKATNWRAMRLGFASTPTAARPKVE